MDLNGDGTKDLISGSWPGQVFIFGGTKSGFSTTKTKITGKDGKPIKPGSASAVFAVDWDQDGDLDLLSGTIGGELFWYENLSGGKGLVLAPKKLIKAEGKALKRVPGGDTAPVVVDWDGDGDLDLLTGSGNGSVYLYRNVSKKGAKGVPTLAARKTLVEGGGYKGAKDGHGSRTKVCVTDYDGDGRLDLLVGDFLSGKGRQYHGYVWLYLRKGPAKTTKTTRKPDQTARDF